MLETLTAKRFSEVVNSKFRVQISETETIELELVEVSDVASTERQERFSIFFRGPLEPAMMQGMCHLEHDDLGPLDIFLVAIARTEDATRYEAVFNRLKKPNA